MPAMVKEQSGYLVKWEHTADARDREAIHIRMTVETRLPPEEARALLATLESLMPKVSGLSSPVRLVFDEKP